MALHKRTRRERPLLVEQVEIRRVLASDTRVVTPYLAIPENDALGALSVIDASDSSLAVIADVNVFLRIDHTWQGDLSVRLGDSTHPPATLVDRLGSTSVSPAGYPSDNFGMGAAAPFTYLMIDDEGIGDGFNTGIHRIWADNLTGAFQPDRDTANGYFTGTEGDQPLSNFDGSGGARFWTLVVRDHAPGDTGTLVSWGIHLTGVEAGKTEVIDSILYVAGTDGADKISVKPIHGGADTRVTINGAKADYPFASYFRLAVYGLLGNDKITLSKKLVNFALVDAGGDEDTVQGGGGHNVVIGGHGDDVLKGGPRNDVLIGGDHRDLLRGGKGKQFDGDLLIGESTSHDDFQTALWRILDGWSESDIPYGTRVANLRAGTGGRPALDGSTLFDDTDTDTLTGGKDLDWFLARADDTITDRAIGESLDFGGIPQP